MTDSIDTAKAGVVYGAVGGIATWVALTILANKYPQKKVDTGTVILATFLSSVVTTLAVTVIQEKK